MYSTKARELAVKGILTKKAITFLLFIGCHKDSSVTATYKELSALTGIVSPSSISGAIKELTSLGLIEVQKGFAHLTTYKAIQ